MLYRDSPEKLLGRLQQNAYAINTFRCIGKSFDVSSRDQPDEDDGGQIARRLVVELEVAMHQSDRYAAFTH